MGTFGSEFVNAKEFTLDGVTVRAPIGLDPMDRQWNNYTTNLNRIINTPVTGLQFTGGYLYFPPGNYFLTDGIVIHPTMTVIFAPNAVLTMPEVDLPRDHTDFVGRVVQLSIHIRGGIQAGLHQIVAPTVVGGVSNVRAGLLFETDTIREVYPEWWGAVAVDIRATRGVDSHAGIQSAIDAAIHNRQYGSSVPIKLTGRYQVSAPLRIGGNVARPIFPESAGRPFVLRGSAGPRVRGLATLGPYAGDPSRGLPAFPDVQGNWDDATLEESSLLIVRGPAGFLIENVAFDASESVTAVGENVEVGKVFSCLRLERLNRDSADAQMSRVRRCFFKGALGVLVQIGEFSHPYRQGTDPNAVRNGNGGQDLLGLVFEACMFSHESTAAPPLRTIPEDDRRQIWEARAAIVDWLRDGVYFRANNTLRLHFIDCFWRGEMRAGVRVYSGTVVFTNLNSHLTRMPVPKEICLHQDARYSTLYRRDAAPSVLWDFAKRQWVPQSVIDPAAPFLNPRRLFVDARDNGCDIYVEAAAPSGRAMLYRSAGVAVASCETQSWRFLSSYPRSDWNDIHESPSYDVYLQDIDASSATEPPVAQSDSGWVPIAPPMIEWLGPFWAGANVTVSGVDVNNVQQRRELIDGVWYLEWSGRIVVEIPRPNARIVDLGSRTGAGPFTGRPNINELDAQLYYKLGISLDGPERLNLGTPWYVNLQGIAVSSGGG